MMEPSKTSETVNAETSADASTSVTLQFGDKRREIRNLEGDYHVADEESHPGSRWNRQGEGDEPIVLEPDHPLMQRFQASLKAHLERQFERISEDVYSMGITIKQKQAEREEIGVLLYDMQQEVSKQQSQIHNSHESLAIITEIRQHLEEEVKNHRREYKIESAKLNSAQKKELELRSELERLMGLEYQFKNWEEEMESELTVSQRMSDKGKVDKKQLAENKRKQDIFLYKLTSEVANLEAKMILLDGQFRIKEKERETISQTVSDACTDLEALNREQHRLLQSWNSVVINIQQRDKTYGRFMQEKSVLEKNVLSVTHEIDAYKMSTHKEMENNERLTHHLNRQWLENKRLKHQGKKIEEKREKLEKEVANYTNMLQQTEKNLEKAIMEGQHYNYQLALLQKDVDKLALDKTAYEDKILETLQEQIAQNKAAQHLNKLACHLRDRAREQEFAYVKGENQFSEVCLEIESSKSTILNNEFMLDDLNKTLKESEKEVNHWETQVFRSKFTICKKQRTVDSLTKQLDVIIQKAGGQELSPLEIKINSLQSAINENDEKCDKLQQFWLRQQGHIVNLTQQRNEQLQEINILRKQVLILDQKNMKIEHDIERHKKEAQDVTRSINKLLQKLELHNTKLHETRGYKDSLDKENLLTQTEYINVLKEAEMESLKLQAKVSDLEEEKLCLTETLMQTQQEYLSWEKKLQMAVETKHIVDKERSKEGEIGTMKCEIHRMQVRYSQLRRAQEKLIQDLEHCVSRRDAIMDVAEAKEKRSIKGTHNTRVSFQKKLEDLRNKIKHIMMDIKSMENLIEEATKRHEELIEEKIQKEDQLKELRETAEELERQLEEGMLHKQQNLELLVRRQRKVRYYGEVKAGHHRLLFRNEQTLDAEAQKQKTINADLISVLESLITDFPSLQVQLTKILNTLRTYSP